MKTKKEIEQLAQEVHYEFQNQGLDADGCFNQYQGFIKGYTQCQQDMSKDLQSILNNSLYVDFISKKEILKYINSLNKQD